MTKSRAIKSVSPTTGKEISALINSLMVASRYMNGGTKDFNLWAQHYVEAGEKLEKLGVPNVTGVDIYRNYLAKVAK